MYHLEYQRDIITLMLDNKKPRIINVTRKPSKCPDCGSQVVDIVYGTGDMTEIEFVLEYRKAAIMGGDNIPRRPPIWSCSCGCKRFRKVNLDGSDAVVKVKMLKNMRKAPATKINWTSDLASRALEGNRRDIMHHYEVEITTELDEHETLRITAVSGSDAEDQATELVKKGFVGLRGRKCVAIEVFDAE